MKTVYQYKRDKEDIIDGVVHALIALVAVIVGTVLADGEIVDQVRLLAGMQISQSLVWSIAGLFYLVFFLLAATGLFVFWRGVAITNAFYSVSAEIEADYLQIKESYLFRSRIHRVPVADILKVEAKGQHLRLYVADGSWRDMQVFLLPTEVKALAKAVRKGLKGD